ncbi:HNH endonuclease [Nitrosomonas oligotropha]|uniref:HNH endonuclease n=1 Tax=Nitrosomonas oligotropha TaxID=42354 RepID=UPI00136DF805|nr:HNH endonuclease signature motif containing protein [Nitrosomonas oligotropha]MXS81562.1 HNH endonuclease [Nitrosomonas oligotropha]
MPKPRRYDDRQSSAARGYGYKWQKARKEFLKDNPLCIDHKERGYIVDATVVDHIKPHRGDQELFWDRSNWQALCEVCHDSHKQRLEKSGIDAGCSVDGIPIDSNHHWNN